MKHIPTALANRNKRSVKVMVFGTFDGFHRGHEHFLREARKHGDYLVAVVARDKTVEEVKGMPPTENENERKSGVGRAHIADKVILGSPGDKYDVIRKERPGIICLGYDQTSFVSGLEKAVKAAGIGIEIRRMGAHMPEKYKTSLMKKEK